MDMTYKYGHKTTLLGLSPELNGVVVVIVGIVVDMAPVMQMYIVAREDGELFPNGYLCIPVPNGCLKQ